MRYQPCVQQTCSKSKVAYIANGPTKANIAIVALWKENKRLNEKLIRIESKKEMKENGITVSRREAKCIQKALNVMSDTIESKLVK